MTADPFPSRVSRARLYEQVAAQITGWIREQGLAPGDRLPAERELAQRLGVSRATLSQALVALEVIGAVEVRHGDGTLVTDRGARGRSGLDHQDPAADDDAVARAIREHADRLPDVIDARDALEQKLAALAAGRRTDDDLARIDRALEVMAEDVDRGGRGVAGDEAFHGAVTAAAHSPVLATMMATISELITETRIESLSQPGRPQESLAGHRRIAEAVRAGDPQAAAVAMHDHIELVSDVALLRVTPESAR